MEECVGIDGTILNEVILPIMNVSRRAANGEKDDEEVLNKSQIYVTTAGSTLFRLRINYLNCGDS